MGQEIREDLDALRGLAAQLNAATAEASMAVQSVDHFLGDDLCIGVSAASRPFESQRALGDDDRELIITTHLAFGRVQGKDRIYVLKATLEKNGLTSPGVSALRFSSSDHSGYGDLQMAKVSGGKQLPFGPVYH